MNTHTSRRFARYLLFVGVGMQLAAAAALSQSVEDPKTVDCRGWTAKVLSQTEMNICAAQDADVQRQTLAKLVGELQEKLAKQPGQRTQLESNQKDWREFIEHDCEWEATFSEGGSIQPLIHSRCLARAAAQRIDSLRVFLCEGEGLTGDCPESRKYESKAEPAREADAQKDAPGSR